MSKIDVLQTLSRLVKNDGLTLPILFKVPYPVLKLLRRFIHYLSIMFQITISSRHISYNEKPGVRLSERVKTIDLNLWY